MVARGWRSGERLTTATGGHCFFGGVTIVVIICQKQWNYALKKVNFTLVNYILIF